MRLSWRTWPFVTVGAAITAVAASAITVAESARATEKRVMVPFGVWFADVPGIGPAQSQDRARHPTGRRRRVPRRCKIVATGGRGAVSPPDSSADRDEVGGGVEVAARVVGAERDQAAPGVDRERAEGLADLEDDVAVGIDGEETAFRGDVGAPVAIGEERVLEARGRRDTFHHDAPL